MRATSKVSESERKARAREAHRITSLRYYHKNKELLAEKERKKYHFNKEAFNAKVETNVRELERLIEEYKIII